MYTEYFGLSEEPFSIAANPRFLYMSEHHREALAHLLYGIRSDSGFVLLTGEVGTGKTTVCRCLLEQLPGGIDVAFVLNPRQNAVELLRSICDELNITYSDEDPGTKHLVDAISKYALEANANGRSTVVIIDEAQNLDADVLEQLRLLTNLETNERKLLRIILLGQPELAQLLARPELRQVEQRITARYHLKPLRRNEMRAYVTHRLAVAGRYESVFSARALNTLHARTGGVPRLINVICDRALLGAFTRSKRTVSGAILRKAITEVRGNQPSVAWLVPASVATFALLVSVAAGTAFMYSKTSPIETEVAASASPTPVIPEPSVELAAAPTPEPAPEPTPEPEPAAAPPPETTNVAALTTTPDPTPPVAPPEATGWPTGAVAQETATQHAYDELFKAWAVPANRQGGDPCEHAELHGLRCHRDWGTLDALLRNNRPVILKLRDVEGNELEALLRQLDSESAIVSFTHGPEKLDREVLARHWLGEYIMMWRLTPQGRNVLRPGRSGRDVIWLSGSLVRAGVAEPGSEQDSYDNALTNAVQAFQQQQGLIPDGVAGRQTLIRLNTLSDPSVPTLNATAGG